MTDIKSSLFEHNELVNNLYKICKSTSIEAATQDAVSNTAAVMKDRLKRVLSSTYKFYFDLSILKDYSEQNANFENELMEQDNLDKYIIEIRNKLTQSQIDAARQKLVDSTTKSLDIQIKQAETCLKNKINKIYAKTQENDGILSRLERIHCDKNIDDLRILMVCKINNNGTVGDTLVLRGHDSILERSDIKGASIYNVNELDSNENIKEYLNNKRVVYRAVNVSLINSGEKVE